MDDEGRYTGRMAFYAYGPEKATAMRALAERTGIDLAASSAYSDSATDLPMLEAVGRPVVVNPDRALAKVARERGWEVRTFIKPVRLRDRVGRTTPVVTTRPGRRPEPRFILWRRGNMRSPDARRVAALQPEPEGSVPVGQTDGSQTTVWTGWVSWVVSGVAQSLRRVTTPRPTMTRRKISFFIRSAYRCAGGK